MAIKGEREDRIEGVSMLGERAKGALPREWREGW